MSRQLSMVMLLLLAIASRMPVGMHAFFQSSSKPRGPRRVPLKYADDADIVFDNWRLGHPRREVERKMLHPFFKLGLVDDNIANDIHQSLQKGELVAAFAALAAALGAVLATLTAAPLVVQWHKTHWAHTLAVSQALHHKAFEETTAKYRQHQRELVKQLHAVRTAGKRDSALPPRGAERIIVVTMATGQEGAAVVRELALAPGHEGLTVRALVRNPGSAKAQSLASLSPRVQLVKCNSTDVAALRGALDGAHAAYLCTTLNSASAGEWKMSWEGGRYELLQGEAFVQAACDVPTLQQVVYGTSPLRKWPESYTVEPPIHYACKWRIEEMLLSAELPVTFLRKCPYHENFTKLTKMEYMSSSCSSSELSATSARVRPGTYFIKGLTPPVFKYNMMDPRDIGAWASIVLDHPSILVGESFSVAADCLSGTEMALEASAAKPFGSHVTFEYQEQPRWLFEALAYVEPTFVYISGLQRWNTDGAAYDLTAEDVAGLRKLYRGTTWREHLCRDGLGQFTATMSDLLPDAAKML